MISKKQNNVCLGMGLLKGVAALLLFAVLLSNTLVLYPANSQQPIEPLDESSEMSIDVYTQYPMPYGGQGPNQPSDMFVPQQMVELYANLTYNQTPVQGQNVRFEVYSPSGNLMINYSAGSNENGVASMMFVMPWSPPYPFGTWHVISTVETLSPTVNDTLDFKYDYLIHIWNVDTNRERYHRGEQVNITWMYGSYAEQSYPLIFYHTLFDNLGVPVGNSSFATTTVGNMNFAEYKNSSLQSSIAISEYAFLGEAALHSNALDKEPNQGGQILCPTYYSYITIVEEGAYDVIVPDDYPTIQEALNNANERDKVFVRNGTYSGPIVINKSLTLEGENRDSTIIDGGINEPSGSIVLVAADNVKVSGFTIQHCRSGGNALWLDSYVNLTFSNNIITGCNEGIRILRSSGNVVSDNIIQDCYYNAGIGFNWAYNNIIYRNIVKNCNVGIGGNYWNNTLFENTISGCVGGWAGWGISDNFSGCIFFHNNIIDNGDQVYNMNPSLSIWDNGCEGNYWSDYDSVDLGGDGIGDIPYIIDDFNQDNYPLMSPYIPGDINHDAIIDIFDVAKIAGIFGCSSADPQYNPHCDINEDGAVDIFDLVVVAVNFGKEWTPP